MGITVKNFVESYQKNKKSTKEVFKNFISKHIILDYVEYLKKDAVCEGIVKATSFVNVNERVFVKLNSSTRYLLFTMKLIDIYTDIDINGDQIATDYDELFKVGAINDLISAIPKSEFDEFSVILKMKVDDFKDNEYSTTALLYNLKNSLSLSEEIINGALEALKLSEKTE